MTGADQVLGDECRHTENQIHRARDHTRVRECANQFRAGAGSLFRSFQDDGAACGKRGADLATA